MPNRAIQFVLLVCIVAYNARPALALSEDFSANPLDPGSQWTFGVGSNANSQFSWTPGALAVHVDSSLPTARLDLPLGATLDDSDSFLVTARFSFEVTGASPTQFAQFAFGLTNQALTGGDRTGSLADFTSDNVFHTLEFDYYPNLTAFGGPTLSPAVFGAQVAGEHAFSNFASIFGPVADLGDNTVGITTLPENTTLEAHLDYDGSTKVLTLSMYQVGGGGSLALVNTELVPLDLDAVGSTYDPSHSFQLDSLSIMAYHDGFTTPEDPSLVADVTYHAMSVVIVPEPPSSMTAVFAIAALFAVPGRRRRSDRPLTLFKED
jgi:hypothetical protein